MKFADRAGHHRHHMSPSLGREWIEIMLSPAVLKSDLRSPSLGREWIEIPTRTVCRSDDVVSLLGEGVD